MAEMGMNTDSRHQNLIGFAAATASVGQGINTRRARRGIKSGKEKCFAAIYQQLWPR